MLADEGDPILDGPFGILYRIGKTLLTGPLRARLGLYEEIEKPWLLKYIGEWAKSFDNIDRSFNRRLGGPWLGDLRA